MLFAFSIGLAALFVRKIYLSDLNAVCILELETITVICFGIVLTVRFFLENYCFFHLKLCLPLCTTLHNMALPVVEFLRQGYKIGKVFA